jgi:large subunit ribosomal protein L17
MRHRKNTVKLGRTTSQREALFASLVSNLILAKRVKTTLPKARAAKRKADKLVTFGKKGTLAARRQALSILKQEAAVAELFGAVAPAMQGRAGGYTRIVKLGKRLSDSSEMCILEWVDFVPKAKKAKVEKAAAAPKGEKAEKPATKPAAKKAKKDDGQK